MNQVVIDGSGLQAPGWRGCGLTWQQGEIGREVKGNRVPAHCEPTSWGWTGFSFNVGLSLFECGEANRSGEDGH